MSISDDDLKRSVQHFWDSRSCGEVYAQGVDVKAALDEHSRSRYELETYIPSFARFDLAKGLDVLEVGVGMGADHLEFARRGPRSLTGVDFTHRAIEWTAERLRIHGFASHLSVADAEDLPFLASSFDLVYSWGVLHHTPGTDRAFKEVHRVLRPGGHARIMIYHKRSVVGFLLWLRYGVLAGRPSRSLSDIYAHHLESPGTKAFTVDEARALVALFRRSEVWSRLSFGDLLQGEVGQAHESWSLAAAKLLWPRKLIEKTMPGCGLMLLVKAVK